MLGLLPYYMYGNVVPYNTDRDQLFTSSINIGPSIIHANYLSNRSNQKTTINADMSAILAGPIGPGGRCRMGISLLPGIKGNIPVTLGKDH